MTTPTDPLQTAVAHHQAGRLNEAVTIYQQILSVDPRHADALHLLGVVAHQTGQLEQAMKMITGAIRIDGSCALYHFNLGELCRAMGKLPEARKSYQRALELDPQWAPACFGLAMTLRSLGDTAGAIAQCRSALAIQPRFAEAHQLLNAMLDGKADLAGERQRYEQLAQAEPTDVASLAEQAVLARQIGQFDQARRLYEQAIALEPKSAELHVGLGDLEAARSQWQQAIAAYQAAIALEPNLAIAEGHLATALQAAGAVEAALAHYQRAVELSPQYATAYFNLGTALDSLGRNEEAARQFEAALGLDPLYVDAHVNLGCYYHMQMDLERALASYDRAVALAPDSAKARFNRAMCLLTDGRLRDGWSDYEWRMRVPGFPMRSFDRPLWDGTTLHGKTLLVHAEQGLGDTVQFARYLPMVRQRGGRVVLLVDASLVPLFEQSGFQDVFGHPRELPDFDVQVPLMSLPHVFGTTLENIPVEIPYLSVEPTLVADWRKRLSDVTGFRVGICWQGNPSLDTDHLRSFPLASMEPLARVPGVRLISLQRVAGLDQLAGLAGRFDVVNLGPEFEVEAGAFFNAAAVIANLDLVITADTAIAHLAGALGAPVWVALARRSDWRWLRQRGDTPWYPAMRLFRRGASEGWPQLFERMSGELQVLAQRKLG